MLKQAIVDGLNVLRQIHLPTPSLITVDRPKNLHLGEVASVADIPATRRPEKNAFTANSPIGELKISVRPRFAKLTYMPNAMPTISATASVRSSYDLIDRAAFLKRIVRTGNMDSNVGATDCETGWFTDDVTGLTDAIIVTTFRKNMW